MKDKNVARVNKCFKFLSWGYMLLAVLSIVWIIKAATGTEVTVPSFVAVNISAIWSSVLLAFIFGHTKVSTYE